ncbi:MAG: RDD family protein [Cellvibrionaceae bacterium]|nr:RDD family protein [Cellvibrionaceae bacterium]
MQNSAPIWRRLAALLYDSFILLALSFFYGALITLLATLAGEQPAEYQPMFKHWSFTLGWLLTLALFYIWFWQKSGQTVGMRAWRLKLVDHLDHERTPSWRLCALRALVAPLVILPAGIGYWYGFLNREKRCLHDRLSRTDVIQIAK